MHLWRMAAIATIFAYNKAEGLQRPRDKKGNIVKRNCNPYVNCIHASIGGGRENMWVLIVEVYEN